MPSNFYVSMVSCFSEKYTFNLLLVFLHTNIYARILLVAKHAFKIFKVGINFM